MRNRYSILLVLLYILPMVFYFCNLQLEKLHIKQQFELITKNTTPKTSTVEISGSLIKKFQWKNNHEFSLNGLMYDVIKTTTNGHSIVYICKIDHKETEINKKIATLLNFIFGVQEHQNTKDTKVLNFYKNTFFTKAFTYTTNKKHKAKVRTQQIYIQYTSEYFKTIDHPPQFT